MKSNADYAELNRDQDGGGLNDFSIERYEQVASHFPADTKTVLDVGCNVGICARPFRAAVPQARLCGVDCVPERVVRARSVLDEVHEGTAAKLPFESGSICAVVACEMIEHLTDQDAFDFLADSKRVLRPGGRLLITTPNPKYLKLKLTGRSVLDTPSHLTEFRASGLWHLVEKVNLRPLRVEGTGRVSRHIGRRFPMLSVYGSYLLIAEAL